MRPVWLLIGLIGIGLLPADAQERKFPYEAVVDVDEDYVRCGPGPKYYPTGKLQRGAVVTVHRHDPGGWAMIAPPADSFSWIQSDYVQKAASGRGSLTANNVIVHVGSALGDERSVYQRMLSKGDTVEVIGEGTFVTERGPVKMYKIKPPPREYRWIAGKSIIPSNGRQQPAGPGKPLAPAQPAPSIQGPIALEPEIEVAEESDAFQSSPFAPSPFDSAPAGGPDHPAGSMADAAASSEPDPPLDSLEAQRQHLTQLDQKFRAMLQAEPQTWDLETLKASYLKLDQAAQHPAFSSHVQQRLATIARYAKIQNDYVEFYRLTTETQERDAQLLSLQRQNEARMSQPLETNPTAVPTGLPTPASPPPTAPTPIGPMPVTPPPVAPAPGATTPMPDTPPPQTGQTPKFSGAGIVQRSTIPSPGMPPYMLIAPDGRLLAYLEPAPGVDMTQATNQALGIVGERGFREELKSDVIVVRGYQPVVLRTTLR